MQHCCNDDGGERRLWRGSEQRRQQNQCEKAKNCRDKICDLAASTCGHGDRCLRKTAHNQKSAEKAAQNVCWSVSDQFLVRIDVAATLHSSRLRCAECLRISDQHNSERTGC